MWPLKTQWVQTDVDITYSVSRAGSISFMLVSVSLLPHSWGWCGITTHWSYSGSVSQLRDTEPRRPSREPVTLSIYLECMQASPEMRGRDYHLSSNITWEWAILLLWNVNESKWISFQSLEVKKSEKSISNCLLARLAYVYWDWRTLIQTAHEKTWRQRAAIFTILQR